MSVSSGNGLLVVVIQFAHNFINIWCAVRWNESSSLAGVNRKLFTLPTPLNTDTVIRLFTVSHRRCGQPIKYNCFCACQSGDHARKRESKEVGVGLANALRRHGGCQGSRLHLQRASRPLSATPYGEECDSPGSKECAQLCEVFPADYQSNLREAVSGAPTKAGKTSQQIFPERQRELPPVYLGQLTFPAPPRSASRAGEAPERVTAPRRKSLGE